MFCLQKDKVIVVVIFVVLFKTGQIYQICVLSFVLFSFFPAESNQFTCYILQIDFVFFNFVSNFNIIIDFNMFFNR
jgi:hypothetical protein